MKIDQQIFKAYDIRGVYPDQINEEIIYRIGQGYAKIIKPAKPVVVGCDVRISSPSLKNALISGLNDAGIDVVDIGTVSTEMYYFAVGNYGYGGGIQVTASHNPKEWNGAKMVRENVIPISGDTGLFEIRDFASSDQKIISDIKGTVHKKEILDDYCRYLLTWIDVKKIKPLKLVYNPNFGFEGIVLKKTIEIGKLPLKLIPLNAEPDGTFPKGRPDPFIPENRVELIELVKKENADLGVAWDADADRVFFCSDDGTFLDSYYTNTLLIKYMLGKFPNSKIIYDPRYTWALIETIQNNGGEALLERVGHSFIKARMRKENALFAGESSGHTYYRDFWYADCGMIPLLQLLEIISTNNIKLSQLVRPVLDKYFISGEINFKVNDQKRIMEKIKNQFIDAKINEIDGISCEYDDWRFSLRGSNTESLLRLNIEAKNHPTLVEKVKLLTEMIKK